MKTSKQKGFTLIELLVVISIIGLLSSIVLASVSTARDKGRIAAGQKFSGYNARALGADAFGVWNFDEPSGDALDTSGNGLNLTAFPVSPPLPRESSDKAVKKGSSVSLNGSTQYFNKAIAPSISFPTQSSGMTVSVWVKPPATVLPGWLFMTNNASSRLFSLYISSTYIQPGVCDGPFGNVTYSLRGDVWQNIAYTYTNGSAIVTVYVDGKVVGTSAVSPTCTVSARAVNQITVGTYGGGFFTGLLDEAAVYTQSLQASEIERIYAQGLPTHSLANAQ